MVHERQLFLILGHFLPFYPINNPKNQNFEIKEKIPGDIIILHVCTKNENHMIHGSLDMECNRIFMLFWDIFCPFTPLITQKIKILKMRKKQMEISSFYTSVPKIKIICYTALEIWHVTDVIVIFPSTPLTD